MRLSTIHHMFGGRCIYCSVKTVIRVGDGLPRTKPPDWMATRDHDTPKVRGGTTIDNNEVLCCYRCNSTKGEMTGPEFLEFRKTGRLAASYIAYLERSLSERGGFAINGVGHAKPAQDLQAVRVEGIRLSHEAVD